MNDDLIRARWSGGRDGGHDQHGEWRPASPPSWTYESNLWPGLELHVFGGILGGSKRRPIMTLKYQLGGRGWSYTDRCDGPLSAMRRAGSIFERLLPEAWRAAWGLLATTWKWDAAAQRWEALLMGPWGSWDETHERGAYAVTRPGSRTWYYEHDWQVSRGGRPKGVPELPTDATAMVA